MKNNDDIAHSSKNHLLQEARDVVHHCYKKHKNQTLARIMFANQLYLLNKIETFGNHIRKMAHKINNRGRR